MSKKSRTSQVEEHPRIWHELKECELENLDMDFIELLESGSPEAASDIIQKHLQPNEYLSVRKIDSDNTTPLQNYLEDLREAGLDVGKGDCQYGYRMPHKKDEAGRVVTELHIFRKR